MGTSMSGTYSFEPVLCDAECQQIVIQQCSYLVPHLIAIRRREEVPSRTEQTLTVIPWSRYQGNSAGECFKHANCWYSREHCYIRATWNMDCHSVTGKNPGCFKVWRPAA